MCVPLSAAVSVQQHLMCETQPARCQRSETRPCGHLPLFLLNVQALNNIVSVSVSTAGGDEEFREGLSSPNHNFKTKLLSSTQTVKSRDPCTMKLNEFHRNIWQQKPAGLMLKTVTSGTSKGTSWLLVLRISANSCNVLSRGIIFSSCILFQTPSARCQSPFISVEF